MHDDTEIAIDPAFIDRVAVQLAGQPPEKLEELVDAAVVSAIVATMQADDLKALAAVAGEAMIAEVVCAHANAVSAALRRRMAELRPAGRA